MYVSVEPSIQAYVARRAAPDRAHVVYFRDPRSALDWLIEARHANFGALSTLMTAAFYDNPWTWWAVRRAYAIYCPAQFLVPKVRQKYRLDRDPGFLLTPIRAPDTVDKATTPTVCYVGRLDPRKKPEAFFDLARQFPDVRFVAIGKAANPG